MISSLTLSAEQVKLLRKDIAGYNQQVVVSIDCGAKMEHLAENLTPRQQETLQAIARFWREGRAPTTGELLQVLGLRSEQGLSNLLRPIERKGFISVQGGVRGRQRLIELTSQGRSLTNLGFPIVGEITAGILEEAFQSDVEWVDNPGNYLRVQPRDFGLRIKGYSMVGAHIVHGDCVIIRPDIPPQTGQIVGALVGNEDSGPPQSTLKYLDFLPDPQWFRLRAANPDYEDLIIEGKNLRIAGVYKGLMRRYDD